jgi:hypothetical protein
MGGSLDISLPQATDHHAITEALGDGGWLFEELSDGDA